MQEVIQVLAYTQQTESCPECGGLGLQKKKFYDDGKVQLDTFIISDKCKSCGGSGTKTFYSMVVRRFEKCPLTKTNVNECIASQKDFKICNEYNSKCIKEQTFKVGSKYRFALQTGHENCKSNSLHKNSKEFLMKCEDCIEFCLEESDNCRLKSGSARSCKEKLHYPHTGFKPRIISGVVRKEGIPFKIKDNELDSFINSMTKEQGFFILDLCGKLSDGEYLLLPKVEVVKE